MGEPRWRTETSHALGELFLWWAQREVERLRSAAATNDGAGGGSSEAPPPAPGGVPSAPSRSA